MEGLKQDYETIGRPLRKAGSIEALIKDVEVELSKNSTFKVMEMSHWPFNSDVFVSIWLSLCVFKLT